MTSTDAWEAQASTDDSHVNHKPRRQTESNELRRRPAQGLSTTPAHSLFGPLHDPYSEAVADWNLGHHSRVREGAYRASLDTAPGQPDPPSQSRRHSLSHQADVLNLRSSPMGFFKKSHDKERRLKSSHGDKEKPLPTVSNGDKSHRRIASESSQGRDAAARPQSDVVDNTSGMAVNEKAKASQLPDAGVHSDLGRERGYLVKDAEHPVDLTGIVDLTSTEDTDVSVTYAPEVTHETRHIKTHEIVQEEITREIHNHHVYHRTLPVLDFEVLPARHYVPFAGGGLTEVPEHEIPGGAAIGQSVQQIIANALSSAMPKAQYPAAPRQFTARTFEGSEGDYKEYIGEDGIKRTEQWWVHPPTIATNRLESGEPSLTVHFHWEEAKSQDITQNESSAGREHAGETLGRDETLKKRWPPPRGASLGKTTMPLPVGAASPHADLPIRTTSDRVEPASDETPVVGVAY